jgi:ELWxxDGT repeat protein
MRGSLASLNAALKHLSVTPGPEFYGDLHVEVEVNDFGFSGAGGAKSAHASTLLSVEDAPSAPAVLYGGVELLNDESVLAAEEDTVVKFNQDSVFLPARGQRALNSPNNLVFSLDHSDAGVDDVSVTVYADNGVVAVETDYSFPLGVSASMSRTDTTKYAVDADYEMLPNTSVHGGGQSGEAGVGITLTGPLSVVNAGLKTLSYKAAANWFGQDILTIRFESQGVVKERSLYLDVAAVNDYPVVVIDGETTVPGQLHEDSTSWAEIVFEAHEDEPLNVDFVSLYDVDNLDLYAFANDAGESTGTADSSEKQQVLEVELSVSNGVLSLHADHSNGVQVTSSGNGRSLLLRGLQTNVNLCLAKIVYTNDLHWNGDDILVVTATDFGVYTYTAGMPLAHVRNVVIRVLPVNDIPYVVFPKGEADKSVLVALEDVGGLIGSELATVDDLDLDLRLSVINGGKPVHYLSSSPIVIVDDDASLGELITLEISVAFGSITLRNLPTVSSFLTFEEGDGVLDKELRVKGEVAHLNTALNGAVYLSDLNFNSEFGHVFPIAGYSSGLEQMVVTVSDEGGGTSTSTLGVDVLPINDSPVFMTGQDVLDATLSFGDDLSRLRVGVDTLFVKEDVAHKLTGVSVRDVDCRQTLVEGLVQVTAYSTNGAVSIPANSPIQQFVVGSGGALNKMLTFTGSIKNVNVALSDLVYVSDSDYYGSDQLILTVDDLGNNGFAFDYNSTSTLTELETKVSYSDTVTIPIVVSSETDAPVITLPAQAGAEYVTFEEDTPGNLVGVAISDVDGNSGDVELHILCSRGRVKMNTVEGLTFTTGHGILDKEVRATGTLYDFNRAIGDMTYLPDEHWHTNMRELDEVVFTVSDLGLEDAEGDISVSTKTLFVEVLAMNDAPEWRVPGQVWRLPLTTGLQRGYVVDYVETSVIDEDMDLIFVDSVYILDADLKDTDRSDLDSVVVAEVDCGFCTLTLENGLVGLQLLAGGNGESMMRFQGTLENVNAALSRFVYRGLVDYNGPDAINFWVSDLGNFGEETGGAPVLNAVATVPVTVEPVNDSPKWSTPDFPVACPEDKLCTISNVQIVDPDAAEASNSGTFDVTVQADFGSVTFNGIEVPASIAFKWDDDGEGSRKVRVTGTMEDINFMLNDLVYSPAEDFTTLSGKGNEVIHLLVSHDGGSPGLTAQGRVMVMVAEGNNDAPIIEYSGATYSGTDEGCEDNTHDYTNDEVLGSMGQNRSDNRGHNMCHRLLSVDVLQCKEDVPCAVEELYVVDADAEEVDYHAVEVTLESSNGNLVMPGATSFELWWDTVGGSGVGGPWPKSGVAVEVSENQHLMRMRGRLPVVNDALSSLAYVSDPHFFGVDTITVTVNDLGFWGSGGAQEAVMVIPVYVDAEEDKPVVEFDRSAMFPSGGSVVKAVEDEFFNVNGVKIVHADSDPSAAISYERERRKERELLTRAAAIAPSLTLLSCPRRYVAGLKNKVPAFDGANVPNVEGAGFIRVMVEAKNLRFRLSRDERLMFNVPNITSEEVRRYDNMFYGYGEQMEVEPRSSDGVDLGLVSGAPTVLWWNNVTIEGRLQDVNSALEGLTVLSNSNFCSDAGVSCPYPDKLAWVRFNVKSLGEIGDGDVNSEARVVDWHWDYDDSRVVYVDVAGVNDSPVVTVGKQLEEYHHESMNLLEGDGLSRVVSSVNRLYGFEDVELEIEVGFRDVDDEVLTVQVSCDFGQVWFGGDAGAAAKEKLFFANGGADKDAEMEVVGSVFELNAAFAHLRFLGLDHYWGDAAAVTLRVNDGESNDWSKRTIGVSLRSVNDPIEMLLGIDEDDYNSTYFVDEGEAVRIGGATLLPHRFEALDVGVRGDKEYTTKTGFELWRSEGDKPTEDRMGDHTLHEANANGDEVRIDFGWGSGDEWQGNLVKDIGTGEVGSTPRYFEEFGGLLYFSAEDGGANGRELWRTDGTTAGTVMVKDIFPGNRGSDPQYLTAFNGHLYFSADGVDTTWMINQEHADECGGFRQDSMNDKVHYAVSESNVWITEKEYDCPYGYHWASTEEGYELFKGVGNHRGVVGEEKVYDSMCGWKAQEWGGQSRLRFRFSDSRITGAYKHVGKWDSVRPDRDGNAAGVSMRAKRAASEASGERSERKEWMVLSWRGAVVARCCRGEVLPWRGAVPGSYTYSSFALALLARHR